MLDRRTEAEQERREEQAVETLRRLFQDAKALGSHGKIGVIARVEDGRITCFNETKEVTHR